MIKIVKDSKNSPIQIRQLTHNKVLKMFSIYLILKKRQKKGLSGCHTKHLKSY